MYMLKWYQEILVKSITIQVKGLAAVALVKVVVEWMVEVRVKVVMGLVAVGVVKVVEDLEVVVLVMAEVE